MKRNKSYLSLLPFLLLILINAESLGQIVETPIEIGKSIELNSKILNEKRTIQIYLPESYSNNLYDYPVFFVLDGEDNFINAVTVVKNQSSYFQQMPEMIIIAISSVNREKFFSITDGDADNTLNFIKDELVPYVDSNYRTEKFRILFGHSLTGPFCFYALSKYNDLFDAFIILAPSMHHRLCQPATKTLENCFNSQKQLNKIIYMAVAEKDNEKHQNSFKMLDSLFNKIAPKNIEYKFENIEGENHWTEAFLGVYKGLKYIFEPWEIPYDVVENANITLLKNHINSLSDKYGYQVKYPEFLLSFIAMEFVDPEGEHKASKETMILAAKELLELNIKNYPKSSNAYAYLGYFHMTQENKDLAIINFEKALKLNPDLQWVQENLTILKGQE